MAKVIGRIDTLTQLIQRLNVSEIHQSSTLQDIFELKFKYELEIHGARNKAQKEYDIELANQELFVQKSRDELHKVTGEHEDKLKLKIQRLESRISTIDGFLRILLPYFLLMRILLRTFRRQIIAWQTQPVRHELTQAQATLDYYKYNAQDIVQEKIALATSRQRTFLSTLKSCGNLLAGAVGEQRAVDELSKLPESYTVINNYKVVLDPPAYLPRTQERVFSAQIDHLVVGPTGVFVLETKYWSKNSINNDTFFNPFDQVKRANFALYCLLNPKQEKGFFAFFKTPPKKVPVKSILLMSGETLSQSDQYVKSCSIGSVNRYITSCQMSLSQEDVERILGCLHIYDRADI